MRENPFIAAMNNNSDEDYITRYKRANGLLEDETQTDNDTVNNGVFGHLVDAAQAGAASAAAGQMRFAGEFMPFGNDFFNNSADKLDDIARRNTPTHELEGADYVASAVGNALGSGGITMAEGALLAAGAGALGGAAGLAGLGGVATGAANAGRLAKFGNAVANVAKNIPAVGRVKEAAAAMWEKPFGKMLVANVAGSPAEALSEAGNLITQMREDGYTDDEIREAALKSAAYNTAWLTVANMLESKTFGKIADKYAQGSNTATGLFKAGALGGASSAVSEGTEEYGQNLIGNLAEGVPFDYDAALESAKMGAVGGGVLGALGGGAGAYMHRQEQQPPAEPEEPINQTSVIDNVRNLEGKIPYYADDGTNCMRTLGIVLRGTPYEGQINVDEAINTARENGQLMNPNSYTPQPGDIAVVNGGNHAVMVTDKGGTIQNGESHNGVYESDLSPSQMFGNVDYYIRTSDYNNNAVTADVDVIEGTKTDVAEPKAEQKEQETQNPFAEAVLKNPVENVENVLQQEQLPQQEVQQPVQAPVLQQQVPQQEVMQEQLTQYQPQKQVSDNQYPSYKVNIPNGRKNLAELRTRMKFDPNGNYQGGKVPHIGSYDEAKLKSVRNLSNDKLTSLGHTVAKFSNDDKLKQTVIAELNQRGMHIGDEFSMEDNSGKLVPYGDRSVEAVKPEQPKKEHKPSNIAESAYDINQIQSLVDKYKGNTQSFKHDYEQAAKGIAQAYKEGRVTEEQARKYIQYLNDVYNQVMPAIYDNGTIYQKGDAERDAARKAQKSEAIGKVIAKARAEQEARKQKALDDDWYRMEHEHNTNNVDQDWLIKEREKVKNVQEDEVARKALNNEKVNMLTERAVGGNLAAQKAFERMSPAVRRALLNRATDRLQAENEKANDEAYGDYAKEPFIPVQYWNDPDAFIKGYNKKIYREEMGYAKKPFMPDVAYSEARVKNGSYYNGRTADALAKHNAVKPEVPASVESTSADDEQHRRARDGRNFVENTLRKARERIKKEMKLSEMVRYTGRKQPKLLQEKMPATLKNHVFSKEGKWAVQNLSEKLKEQSKEELYDGLFKEMIAKYPKNQPIVTATNQFEERLKAAYDKVKMAEEANQKGSKQEKSSVSNSFTENLQKATKLKEAFDDLRKENYKQVELIKQNTQRLVDKFNSMVDNGTPISKAYKQCDDEAGEIIDKADKAVSQYATSFRDLANASNNKTAIEKLRNENKVLENATKKLDDALTKAKTERLEKESIMNPRDFNQNAEQVEVNPFDGNRARKSLDALIGRKDKPQAKSTKTDQEEVKKPLNTRVKNTDVKKAGSKAWADEHIIVADTNGKRIQSGSEVIKKQANKSTSNSKQKETNTKFVNVFNEDELEAEKQKVLKMLNGRLSANPMFDPDLMKSLFKIGGIYLQKGINNLADWTAVMVDALGERVRPFLPAVWSALGKYPNGKKFNDDIMTAVMEYVGDGVYNQKDLATIKTDFKNEYGDEYLDYVESAYEGVAKYPTSMESDNVVQSNQATTEEDGNNGQTLSRPSRGSGNLDEHRPSTTSEREHGQNDGRGQGDQNSPTENGNEVQRTKGTSGAGRNSGDSLQMERPASEDVQETGERGKSDVDSGTSEALFDRPGEQSNEAGGYTSVGENAEIGGSTRHTADVSGERRRIVNYGDYSILSNGNYHINNEDVLVGNGSHDPEARFSINMKAIEILNSCLENEIEPTAEEKHILAQYSGWGGLKKFLFQGTWENPKYFEERFLGSFDWKEANNKLRTLLGRDKWEAAWLNTSNQFYTPPSAIRYMWELAERLGFKGGKVLEPSMGIGNFFAEMPANLQKDAVLTGIEIDPIAGEMAKLLYPDAHVFVQGYEKHQAAENSYDFVIGNVPFGSDTLKDNKYSAKFAHDLQIHDFFLVKGMGQLRPGGIMMVISTHNSLDKANDTVRAYLARQAELVGAIRLPNKTFKGTGADVLTDIIVLKKRSKPLNFKEGLEENWVKSPAKQIYFKGKENGIRKNNYFTEHPEMIAGTEEITSGKYGPEYSVATYQNKPLEKIMGELIPKFPKNIMKETKSKAENEYVEADKTVSNRGLYYNKKGQLVIKDGVEEIKITKEDYRFAKNESDKLLEKRMETVKSLIDLYQKYNKLIYAERDNDPNLEEVRKEALDAFNKHVEQYGYFVKYKKDKNGLMKTTFNKELQFFARIGDGEKFTDLSALDFNNTPAPILLHPVLVKAEIREATVPNAYLKQVFSGVNTIDLDLLAKDAQTDKETALKELVDKNAVYKLPNGGYQPTNIYLSGNVVTKLEEAEAAYNAGDKDMKRNIEALKAVRPKLVPSVSITASMGVNWVEPKDYEDFIANLLGYQRGSDIGVHVVNNNGSWKVTIDKKTVLDSPLAAEKYGMKAHRVNFTTFVEAAMNKRHIEIKKQEPDKILIVDEERTKNAEKLVENLHKEFGKWLWQQDNDRKLRMEKAYNDKMNAIVPPTFDASLMQFDGLVQKLNGRDFDPRKHQRDFVLRALVHGRGAAYHEAGTGKTLIMAMLCHELKRTGKARRPLIIAHPANAAAVAKDFKTFYPTSKVLYIPKLEGGKKIAVSKRLIGQIKAGDWDAVVIDHNLIKKIAFSEETLKAVKHEELESVKQTIQDIEIEAADEEQCTPKIFIDEDFELADEDRQQKKGGKKATQKAQRAMDSYKKMLLEIEKQAMNYDNGDTIRFEETGIDAVLVDECHIFKKAPKITKRQVKGVDTQTSTRGYQMSCITDYINAKNDNKGVFLFSGTMITNTIPEIHTMMRFVMPDDMKKAGIYNLDDFLNIFTGTSTDVEITSAGTWEPVERLTRFANIPELKQISGQDFDIVMAKDLEGFEKRSLSNGKNLESKDLTDEEREELLNGRTETPKGLPANKVINVVIPKTKRSQAVLSRIQEVAKKWKDGNGTARKIMAIEGLPLRLQTLPASIGMSVRNLNPNLRDYPNSKVNTCVRNVLEIYNSHEKACQVIFAEKGYSDVSTRKAKDVDVDGNKVEVLSSTEYTLPRYNMIQDIVEKLVEQGIPREEIAVVDGKVKDEARAEIAKKVSDAEIRVVIGQSQTLGIGVNMQENMRAIHHLDAVWQPGDLDQMDKRAIRQGNCWNCVLNYRYIAPSYDGKMWTSLSQKDSFIKAFINKNNHQRIIDSDALSENGEEGANDIVNTLVDAVDDVRVMEKVKLEKKIEDYESNELLFQKGIDDAKADIYSLKKERIPKQKQNIIDYQKDYDQYKQHKDDKFSIKIKTLKGWQTVTDSKKAIDMMKNLDILGHKEKAEYLGFPICLKSTNDGYVVDLYGTNGNIYTSKTATSFAGIKQCLANTPKRIAKAEKIIKDCEARLKIKESAIKEKNPYSEILATLKDKLKKLEQDMKDNPIPAPEWFRLKAPIDTFFDYDGKQYILTGYSTAEKTYSVKGVYIDEDGNEQEEVVPANQALKDGFPILSDEEMKIDPKKEVFDESDETDNYEDEISKALGAVDNAFSNNPTYTDPYPLKVVRTDADGIIDVTADYVPIKGREYSISPATASRAREDVAKEIQRAWQNVDVKQEADGSYTVTMPNSKKIGVVVDDKIMLNKQQSALAVKAHNTKADEVEGYWNRWEKLDGRDVDGVLHISLNSRQGTVYHEVMHAAADLCLNKREKAALYKYFSEKARKSGRDISEEIADGYKEWALKRQSNKGGSMFGKLYQKIKDFLSQVKEMFDGSYKAHKVFRDIESGKVWGRSSQDSTKQSSIKYSVAPTHKVADAFTNTERKTVIQNAKDFFSETKKDFRTQWLDKNNSLKGLDELTQMTGSLSVYDKVQNLTSTTAGMLKAICEGTPVHIDKANQHLSTHKMKHRVTLAMALDKINNTAMDKAYPKYLAENGFKNWVDALGAYLGAERLLEMNELHIKEFEKELQEYNERKALYKASTHADEKELLKAVGKKPVFVPYRMPNGLTASELKAFSKAVPKEFREAADIFYKVNDNIITVMEDAQVFSKGLGNQLRTKYKRYCPLLRDFSDTAAADNFIGGLTMGGRGIGNVSVPLKKIGLEGSDRSVLNPLETVMKSYAVMLNRAERNKVGLMAVRNAYLSGLTDLIQEVPEVKDKDGKVVNATADPKNCIFTVLINGKKKAFKTTQELYSPIVGYNLPAASLCLNVARMAANMLRTGATMSPSFIIRNFLRDTIFAGVSSQNGFIPFVDSIKGALALWNDPAMRAEFEAAGVTEFNFYASQNARVKTLDKMAGYKTLSGTLKEAFKTLEDVSNFVESSTRMGEFMKARKAGKSMDEAARAGREITLDFSRSGVMGEQLNRYIPFFNACLQGSEKMYLLFRNDFRGTALKMFEYIVLPSMILYAMNYDDDWYKELDPELKNNYWFIGENIRIPKPQEAGVLFGSGIEALLDQAMDKDKDAVENWLKTFLDNMSPSIIPTLVLPLLEWESNYSLFRGREIVSKRYQHLPDELQYNDYTSETSKAIGKNFKVSPMKIDSLVRGYTGTMGALVWSLPDHAVNKATEQPAKHWYENAPFRDFTVIDANRSRHMNEFYELLNKANQQHAGYGIKGKPKKAVQSVRTAGKMIADINKDIQTISAKKIPPEQKRALIDKKRKQAKLIAEKAVTRYSRYFQ